MLYFLLIQQMGLSMSMVLVQQQKNLSFHTENNSSDKEYFEATGHRTLLIFPLAAMLTFCQIIRKLNPRIF